MMTVIHIRNKQSGDIYIGRGSPFGNPFKIGLDGDRYEVIKKFRTYFENKIQSDETFRKQVLDLEGKRLVCFCKPKACHGDVIITWLQANGYIL